MMAAKGLLRGRGLAVMETGFLLGEKSIWRDGDVEWANLIKRRGVTQLEGLGHWFRAVAEQAAA
jgi:hypothetical protein